MKQSMKAPWISREEIFSTVENLRREYESLQTLPVDIESFLEFDLGLDIIPFTELRDRIGAEAMISQDYTSIYVDSKSYMNDNLQPRMKFSLAHEIGHYFLHKNFFSQQNVSNANEWIDFMMRIQLQYVFLEHHANTFASFLLVPGKALHQAVEEDPLPSISTLTRRFGVSAFVIQRRLAEYDMKPCFYEM